MHVKTWTITADIERRIQALEMRYFHRLLGISYRDHITNEEVKASETPSGRMKTS